MKTDVQSSSGTAKARYSTSVQIDTIYAIIDRMTQTTP